MEGLATDLSQRNGQYNVALGQSNGVEHFQPALTASVSLSSPEQSEADSDFATDGAGTEAGHSRPGSSDEYASDDSLYGAASRSLHQHRCSLMHQQFPV